MFQSRLALFKVILLMCHAPLNNCFHNERWMSFSLDQCGVVVWRTKQKSVCSASKLDLEIPESLQNLSVSAIMFPPSEPKTTAGIWMFQLRELPVPKPGNNLSPWTASCFHLAIPAHCPFRLFPILQHKMTPLHFSFAYPVYSAELCSFPLFKWVHCTLWNLSPQAYAHRTTHSVSSCVILTLMTYQHSYMMS